MSLFCNGSNLSASFFLPILPIFFTLFQEITFHIQNSCPYTVWAAAVPGGGRQLDQGQNWDLSVSSNTTKGRIWGRTKCSFDEAGRGSCESGGCGGLLECQENGSPPNTLAEYALGQNMDFFDISLVDGFNIPMEFSPTSDGCRRGVNCTGDINWPCPDELRDPGGCNNPCTVFKNNQYCCTSGSPYNLLMFFKDGCPDVYSYSLDDSSNTFTCPAGSNYRAVFCP